MAPGPEIISFSYLYTMKRNIFLITSVLLLVAGKIIAQPSEANNSLLWRISGNGLSKPSYLFGTIHLICKSDYLWTAKMEESLTKAEKVCFEMDLDDNSVMESATSGFMDNSGKKLKEYFTPAEYQELKKFVKDSVGMDIAMFQAMKPIALQSVIEMKVTNCMDAVSYEETIMKKARERHKEIMGLEEAAEQIGILDSLPVDSVVKETMENIRTFSQSRQEYAQLVSTYKRQELPRLYEMITGTRGLGDNMDMFLDDRNKKWISRMTVKMKASSVFFAVGAGHLWGGNGVISLLRAAGYKVEPVK